jgi:hypothetical protein
MGSLTGDWDFQFLNEITDDQAEQYNDDLF